MFKFKNVLLLLLLFPTALYSGTLDKLVLFKNMKAITVREDTVFVVNKCSLADYPLIVVNINHSDMSDAMKGHMVFLLESVAELGKYLNPDFLGDTYDDMTTLVMVSLVQVDTALFYVGSYVVDLNKLSEIPSYIRCLYSLDVNTFDDAYAQFEKYRKFTKMELNLEKIENVSGAEKWFQLTKI